MQEIYVSVDIEADGPIPGVYSMLSLGAAAFEANRRTPIGMFEANLLPLPDAITDPETMAWWQTQPDAWAYVHQNQQDPRQAMRSARASCSSTC